MASPGARAETFPRPPHSFTDANGRTLVVRAHGDDRGPLDDLYDQFDDDARAQGVPPRSSDRRRTWIGELLESPYNVVAWDDTVAVAHGVLVPHDGTAELAIFVRPDRQSAGVGTGTVRCLLGHGRAGGLEHVHLVVAPSNAIAVRLYRTVGFTVTARHRGEYKLSRALRASSTRHRSHAEASGAGNGSSRPRNPFPRRNVPSEHEPRRADRRRGSDV